MVDKLLTVNEVAEIMRVDTDTIYRWLNAKKVPGTKIGGSWRIRQSVLDRLLNQKEAEYEQSPDNTQPRI